MHWRDLLSTWNTHNSASMLDADFAKMPATFLKLKRLDDFCEGIRHVNERNAGPLCSRLGSSQADGTCCRLLFRATFAVFPCGRQWELCPRSRSRHRPARCAHQCAWLSWIAVKCQDRWFQRRDQLRDLS